MNKNSKILVALCLILVGTILISFQSGAVSSFDEQIFWLLRFPRTMSAIAIGGGLAVSGAILQCIFQNPLADPFTIGISSAAVLGAIIGALFRLNSSTSAMLGSILLSFLFSFSTILGLSVWMKKRARYVTEVLLVGIILGFFFSAVATLLLAITDPATWTSALSWIYGSLGKLSLSSSILVMLVTLIFTLLIWIHSKQLDLLAVGEISAESVGLKTESLRFRMFLLVTSMIAVCVATAGMIGFVGLIVPHLLRKSGLHAHRFLIPACYISGGALLTLSDTFARTVAGTSELPVGIILAVFGAPFLFLLTKRTS